MRKFAFELKMQDKSSYLLAADSESEMEEWISTLNKILHSSFELAMQEKRNGDLHDGLCVCLSECVDFYYWTTQTTTTPYMRADNTETSQNTLLCQSSEISNVSRPTLYVLVYLCSVVLWTYVLLLSLRGYCYILSPAIYP